MQFYHSLYSTTLTATSVFDAFDLIDFSDGKITADDAAVKAVALHPATEVGLDVAGMVIGEVRVRARGAIAKGQKVISAAAGGVKAAAVGSVNMFAVALTDAADGEFITIFVK
ncbi:DUF2190 family protein [Rhizobium cremeum]|uniref:capsid cement protein n=1 Tax=Rhizobium cremeum TaxID=2813827 RepID=UPI001FD52582|nr:capsid cement protein [Rhizobium cremeum]MCJ7996072.1 DUF2190 family protein [Rhizobium cremeum]MCJ8001331.1 DUF2190 family protein [Rhizobium cremeum]